MGERAELAEKYFKEGYNCCQAVVLAFQDKMGVDRETALKLAAPFGGGLGRMREVCGAVSGMSMAAGAMKGNTDPKDQEAKKEHYKLIQEMAGAFKEENGSIVCRELLGLDKKEGGGTPEARTDKYYKKRPCAELCACAAGILEKKLEEG